jgi:uncharacterized cupin superfamily protein
MHVTRFAQAPEYQAPGHDGMRTVRMLGKEAGPAGFAWMGLSIIEPGGCIQPSVSPFEKLYLVVEGEVEFANGEQSERLGTWDACRFAQSETRAVRNTTDRQAVILLVMANTVLNN